MKSSVNAVLPIVLRLLVLSVVAGTAGAAEYVVTSTSDAGPGSLRQAILDANASGTAAVISFNLGGVRTIAPTTALPSIDVPVTLDGRRGTSAATPGVELSGAGIAAKNANGLRINGPGSTIRGLAINRFPAHGLHITAPDVKVVSCYIGLALDGSGDAGNLQWAIIVDGDRVTIGGPGEMRNVIAGNDYGGIGISGAAGRVETNLIGVDVSGGRAVPNGGGVSIWGPNAVIAGTADEPVVISGNLASGVEILARGATIYGAAIGVDITRRIAIGNHISGIVAINTVDTRIGRDGVPAPDNIIGGNRGSGILFEANMMPYQMFGTVANSYIGVGLDGARVGNGMHGIEIVNSAYNLVGTTGWGNTIAYNALAGVAVTGNAAVENTIVANSIYENGGLGIDLGADGVTPNDTLDADTGPNRRINFPVLTSAQGSTVAPSTSITGTLSAAPSSLYRIDYFASPQPDPSGHGEGRRYLSSFSARTNSSGVATLSTSLPVGAGAYITATATDLDRYDTSEFSPAIASVASDPSGVLRFAASEAGAREAQASISVAVVRENGTTGTVTVNYETVPLNATSGSDFVEARGRLTFAPGETSKTITVAIVDDTAPEEDEAFLLRLVSTTGGAIIGTPSEITLRILNDDGAPVVDLEAHFTAPTWIKPDQPLGFSANATNRGSLTVTRGTLLISIHPVAVATYPEACAPYGNAYVCTISNLAPGATAAFQFATVVPQPAGYTELRAVAHTTEHVEPNRTNNERTARVYVGNEPVQPPKRRSVRH